MIPALLIAIAVLIVLATVALLLQLRSLAPAAPLAGRTVVVHTRDDQSIRGILVGHHVDRLILHEAAYLHTSGDQAVAGVIHVPVTNVSTVQELTD